VPPLYHTLNQYLDSVKPLVFEDELTATAFFVSEFEKGVRKYLEAKLMERAKYERNWVSECLTK
jgi:hypothetical protein